MFTTYPGQNTTLVLVAMPPNDDSSPLSPLRAGCGLRGERPPHGTMQGHLSVQPPWSPGEVKRPRNGTTLRKQLGNVCWTERPVGTARTVGTRSQEDVPPRPSMTCTWGMVVIWTGVTEVPGRTGRRLGRLDTPPRNMPLAVRLVLGQRRSVEQSPGPAGPCDQHTDSGAFPPTPAAPSRHRVTLGHGHVTSGKRLNLHGPQFPHLSMGHQRLTGLKNDKT